MAVSEAQKASAARWDAKNLKRLSLAIPITLHQRMKEHTQNTHETTNGFIRRAIETTIEREQRRED